MARPLCRFLDGVLHAGTLVDKEIFKGDIPNQGTLNLLSSLIMTVVFN